MLFRSIFAVMSLGVKVEASVAPNVSRHDRAVHGERYQRAPVDPKVGLAALSGKVRALLPTGASTFLIPGKNVPRPFCALALAAASLGFPVGNLPRVCPSIPPCRRNGRSDAKMRQTRRALENIAAEY